MSTSGYNKAYQIVKDVLSDGNGHPVSELNEALSCFLGLKRSQSSSRLYRMVTEGKIINYDRGMYKLNDTTCQQTSNKTINKTLCLFSNMKSLINNAQYSSLDVLKITDKDREALKTLEQITSMVDTVLSSYREEGDYNQ